MGQDGVDASVGNEARQKLGGVGAKIGGTGSPIVVHAEPHLVRHNCGTATGHPKVVRVPFLHTCHEARSEDGLPSMGSLRVSLPALILLDVPRLSMTRSLCFFVGARVWVSQEEHAIHEYLGDDG